MFKVINDADEFEVSLDNPLAAISLALTQSMASTTDTHLVVADELVCVARGGRLLAPDGQRRITPAEVVRTAESLRRDLGE